LHNNRSNMISDLFLKSWSSAEIFINENHSTYNSTLPGLLQLSKTFYQHYSISCLIFHWPFISFLIFHLRCNKSTPVKEALFWHSVEVFIGFFSPHLYLLLGVIVANFGGNSYHVWKLLYFLFDSPLVEQQMNAKNESSALLKLNLFSYIFFLYIYSWLLLLVGAVKTVVNRGAYGLLDNGKVAWGWLR